MPFTPTFRFPRHRIVCMVLVEFFIHVFLWFLSIIFLVLLHFPLALVFAFISAFAFVFDLFYRTYILCIFSRSRRIFFITPLVIQPCCSAQCDFQVCLAGSNRWMKSVAIYPMIDLDLWYKSVVVGMVRRRMLTSYSYDFQQSQSTSNAF